MQIYKKPELNIEPFDVEDVITLSAGDVAPGSTTVTETETSTTIAATLDQEEPEGWASAPTFDSFAMQTPTVHSNPIQESELPFDTEIRGGNPIQEGLNALYENFVEHF